MNNLLSILALILLVANNLTAAVLFTPVKEYYTGEDKVCLRDLVADISLPEPYGNIVICSAPFKKTEKIIRSSQIAEKLKKLGMKEYLPLRNKKIILKNRMLLFPAREQQQLVEKRVAALLKDEKYKLEYRSGLNDVRYPRRGDIDIRLVEKSRLRKSGNQLFTIDIKLNGRLYKRVIINTYIRLFRQVLVAQAKIPSGTDLSNQQYKSEELEVTGKENSMIYDEAVLKGYKAGKIIFAGRALKKSALKKIPDIARGQVVEMCFQSGNINLALPVKAMNDISVGNKGIFTATEGGKKFKCLVVSSNRVENCN